MLRKLVVFGHGRIKPVLIGITGKLLETIPLAIPRLAKWPAIAIEPLIFPVAGIPTQCVDLFLAVMRIVLLNRLPQALLSVGTRAHVSIFRVAVKRESIESLRRVEFGEQFQLLR
jgi:hypothetical protein